MNFHRALLLMGAELGLLNILHPYYLQFSRCIVACVGRNYTNTNSTNTTTNNTDSIISIYILKNITTDSSIITKRSSMPKERQKEKTLSRSAPFEKITELQLQIHALVSHTGLHSRGELLFILNVFNISPPPHTHQR